MNILVEELPFDVEIFIYGETIDIPYRLHYCDLKYFELHINQFEAGFYLCSGISPEIHRVKGKLTMDYTFKPLSMAVSIASALTLQETI